MDTPLHEQPQRGQVFLASVPFAAKRTALKAADDAGKPDSTDHLAEGFTAEIQFKLRPVLVVQNDTITSQSGYEYVLVASIYSLKDKHRTRPGFEHLLAQRLPQVFYLDKREQGVTRPSYVALAHLPLLHRSMLKERRGVLTVAEMLQIDERLRFCLSL